MLRRALLVLGPMSFAVATLFALAACEDDGASGAGGAIDAGAVGVGNPPVPTSDAAEPDDGMIASGVVSIGVTGTLPDAVSVYFHDASGNVIDTAQTGADGKASSSRSGIGMVTALQVRGLVHHAVTWTNVSPGDNLTLAGLPDPASAGTYTVTTPLLLGNRGGFTAYSGNCASPAPVVTGGAAVVDLTSFRCIGPSPSALLASAVLATTGATQFSFTKTGPAAPFGGSNIPATLGAWAASSTTAVFLTNDPTAAAVTAGVGEIANGLLFNPVTTAAISTGAATSFAYPAGFADALQATAITAVGASSFKTIAKRFEPGPAVSFDYGQFLGTITGSTVDATNASRPVLAWGGDSTAGTDGGLVNLLFTNPNAPRGSSHSWTFVVPPGTSTITAPQLPGDGTFLPAADAGAVATFGRPFVAFVEADAFESPAAFRQQQGATLGPYRLASLLNPTPVLAANGTFRTTTFFQAQ